MHQITTVSKYLRLRNHPRLLREGVRRGYYRAHKGGERELPFLRGLAAKLQLGPAQEGVKRRPGDRRGGNERKKSGEKGGRSG